MNVSVAKLSKTTKIMTEYGEEVSVTEVEEEKIISEAEADKNMIDLLQEKERQKKESKKARAAKKREKKKQKKKQKQEVTETEHGKSKNSSPEVESEEQQLKDENEKEKLVKQPPAATITSTMGSSCVASSTLPKPVLQDIFQPIGAERTMRKTPGPNINTEFKGSSWNYDRDLEKTRPKVPASANSRVSGRDNSKIHATNEISDANIEKIKASWDTTITVKKGRAAEREIHQETIQEVLDQKNVQSLQQEVDDLKKIMAEQKENYLENVQSLQQEVDDLKKIMAEQKENYLEMQRQLEQEQLRQVSGAQPSIEVYLGILENIFTTMERLFSQHSQKENQRVQDILRQADSRYERKHTAVAQAIIQSVNSHLDKRVCCNIIPSLTMQSEWVMDQILHEMTQKLTAIDSLLKDINGKLVQRQHGRGKMKILHRNLLLPITSLPVRDSEADQGTVDQPSAVRAPIQSSPVRIAPTQSDSSAVSSPDGNRQRLDRKQDSRPEGDSPVPRYVIPQRRGLNPDATVFVPKRTQRMRTKPAWLNSKDWVT